MRVRFCGFGGQGIVLAGYITGNAAVTDGKNAIQNQSYGSESRGGHCKSDVIVESGEIFELELDEIDVLVAMSQAAHDLYIDQLEPDGIVIIDSDLVKARKGQPNLHSVAFTDIAYQAFNRKIMGNMVMLGYLVGATGVAAALGDSLEAISILVVLLLNAGVGFATELRARRAMEGNVYLPLVLHRLLLELSGEEAVQR